MLIRDIATVVFNFLSVRGYPKYLQLSPSFQKVEPRLVEALLNGMVVHEEFVNDDEERSLLNEIEPQMKRMRYEFDHWDDAIHGYREREKLDWNEANQRIIDRVKETGFDKNETLLDRVHILDLNETGYIKPHVDAVKFCGSTICGISLLSDSVMKLVNNENKDLYVDILLRRKSMYVMRESARYDYTHEILENQHSFFDGKMIAKGRRVSIICRNAPPPNQNT